MHISKKMNLWMLAQRMGDDATDRDAMRMRELLIRYGFGGYDTSELSAEVWDSLMNEVVEEV